MRQGIGVLVGLCVTLQVTAQPNLVPNPSFEAYVHCPYNVGISTVVNWMDIQGSPDHYHECGSFEFDVPVSWGGGGHAKTGLAYIGLGIRHMSEFAPEFREYAGTPLLSPLIAGAEYQVSFYVSFGDSAWYAGKNIGVYFSVGQPMGDLAHMLTLEPQVRYEGDAFLTEKESWTRIEGTYSALGGENFLTIGNFDDNEATETLFVEGGGVLKPNAPDYWKAVYYFIDDVSVIDVDSLVSIEEGDTPSISIYPNPANATLIVEAPVKEGETAVFELHTATGALVKMVQLQNARTDIDATGLSAGLYFFKVIVNDRQVFTGKQVILK